MLTNRALSPTTFTNGPDDDLITGDVYTKNDGVVINNLPPLNIPLTDNTALVNKMVDDDLRGGLSKSIIPKSSNLLDKATNFLKTGFNAIGGLKGAINIVSKTTGSSLVSRLTAGNGLTGIPGLGGSVASNLNSILKQVPGLNTATNQAISNTVGAYLSNGTGAAIRLNANNLTTSMGVTNLINTLTNNKQSIIDKDGSIKLIGVVSALGINSGITNSFSSMSTLANGDKSILIPAALTALNQAARTGSVNSLKDIGSVVGSSMIRSLGSSVLKQTSSNYKLPIGSTQTSIVGDAELIRSAYNEIDPDFLSKAREVVDFTDPSNPTTKTVNAVDITTLQAGSPDFLRTMESGAIQSSDQNQKFSLLATAFPAVAPEDSLKQCFPLTLTSIDTQTVNSSSKVDPYGGLSQLEYLKKYTKLDGLTSDERAAQLQNLRDNTILE